MSRAFELFVVCLGLGGGIGGAVALTNAHTKAPAQCQHLTELEAHLVNRCECQVLQREPWVLFEGDPIVDIEGDHAGVFLSISTPDGPLPVACSFERQDLKRDEVSL